MGKAVALHPVAVILSVAAGSYLAGIPGALFSVPILAVVNSAVRYIAARTWEYEQVPVAPAVAGMPADRTSRDVDLPAAYRPGRDAGTGTAAEQPDAQTPPERGSGDEPRGE
jgi:hypothetical protein